MRRNGMTRRQRSRFNKLAWAEQRALLELQWKQEREARAEGRPTPSTYPSPPPSPLPNARGRVTRARVEEPHRPTPDCQCSECRRYDELEGHA